MENTLCFDDTEETTATENPCCSGCGDILTIREIVFGHACRPILAKTNAYILDVLAMLESEAA